MHQLPLVSFDISAIEQKICRTAQAATVVIDDAAGAFIRMALRTHSRAHGRTIASGSVRKEPRETIGLIQLSR